MAAVAPAPPVRWRAESKEIGGFYTFLKSEVDKLKAAQGKMRTHAMKQCNVLLKEYVSFNPYIQRLYFDHIRSKKYGDSRYPQAYRCSMRQLRFPSVWDSSPPAIFRRESTVNPNHIMSESSSMSGYESSDHASARIRAKTPKPEQGRKKSPEGSHHRGAETSRNPERENGKNRSPVLIRYRSPDSNPERPSQGSPYRISEGSPFKYRKAAGQRLNENVVDSSVYRQPPPPHRQVQLDHPTFARVMATSGSEVVSEVSRFLTPQETRAAGSRYDLPTRFSSGSSSDQSTRTAVFESLNRRTARASELSTLQSRYSSPTKTMDGSNVLSGVTTEPRTSTTTSSSTAGMPASSDLQHRHQALFSSSSRTTTTTTSLSRAFDTSSRTLDTSSQVGLQQPRTTSSDAVTSSSGRGLDRVPGTPSTKEVSFDNGLPYKLEHGVSYQDEGTQTYSDRIPGAHALRYGIVQGGVSPPHRSDPDFPSAATMTTTTTTTATITPATTTTPTTTTNATRNEVSDQQHPAASSSTHTRNANSSPSKLPGGGIYTYKMPAGGSYRMLDHSARLPEAKLVEGSSNIYVIEDATQYKVSESRTSEHVTVGHLLYGSETRTLDTEKRSRTKSGDNALRLKRKKKKFAAHRCDVNDLVPEQRRVRRRSIQNRVPETRKYMFYKYYGFAGQGAKTSWGHNRPLGISPPHAQKAPPPPVVEGERPDAV
ncbi:hypothetical protein SELMODRAFT_409366 [Selaginella moellendorffii]|uniref:Uncharacterized protein n=1 Tax=Selaginella moellendorffii TaxID=88036 RepID=D8RB81_SELML|nr:hypothetical protein SELMODRAFT_409366 [Selaginella moellendorffii]